MLVPVRGHAGRERGKPHLVRGPGYDAFARLDAGEHEGLIAVEPAELERALARTRRMPGPAATLSTVEALFARAPAAAGYVRALREQRYAGHGPRPTTSGRRAVRAELARGSGLAGRLRAWWALPPKPR